MKLKPPVDIVIPLGDGSGFRNQELKYSLRSVEKFLKNYRNIYLFGVSKPHFLNDKIIFLRHEDNIIYNKERRIMEKFYFASRTPEISETFLMFNDDYFLTKSIDALNIPYYHKGELQNALYKKYNTPIYKVSLQNTYNALVEKELQTFHFDIHFPMYYNKRKFRDVMDSYNWEIKNGYVVKSLYANSLKIKGEHKKDCKIQEALTESEIRERIKDTDLFSSGEITRAMINTLQKLYPEKSGFEI